MSVEDKPSPTPNRRLTPDFPVPFISSIALGFRQLAALPARLGSKVRHQSKPVALPEFPSHPWLSPLSDGTLLLIALGAALFCHESAGARVAALLATLLAASVPARPSGLVLARLLVWLAAFVALSISLSPVLERGSEYSQSGSAAALGALAAIGAAGLGLAIATRRRRIPSELVFLLCAWSVALTCSGLFVSRTATAQALKKQQTELEIRLIPARRAHAIRYAPERTEQEVRHLIESGDLVEARYVLKEIETSFPAFPGLAELRTGMADAEHRERKADAQREQAERSEEAERDRQRLLSEQLAERQRASKLLCLQGCLAVREQCLADLQAEDDCVVLQRRCIERRCGGL